MSSPVVCYNGYVNVDSRNVSCPGTTDFEVRKECGDEDIFSIIVDCKMGK